MESDDILIWCTVDKIHNVSVQLRKIRSKFVECISINLGGPDTGQVPFSISQPSFSPSQLSARPSNPSFGSVQASASSAPRSSSGSARRGAFAGGAPSSRTSFPSSQNNQRYVGPDEILRTRLLMSIANMGFNIKTMIANDTTIYLF